jgi:FtsZ-binding cell division protein ZapB
MNAATLTKDETIRLLQAEVERLRGLLREAADAERDHYATQVSVLMKSGWYKRIRETLGDD